MAELFPGLGRGIHLGWRHYRLGRLPLLDIHGSSLFAHNILSVRNSALANGGLCSRSGVHVHHEHSDPLGTSLTSAGAVAPITSRLRRHARNLGRR